MGATALVRRTPLRDRPVDGWTALLAMLPPGTSSYDAEEAGEGSPPKQADRPVLWGPTE
ncbi:hypothetical protein PUR71_36035 [Streptomyces sp. SP17BM10]|uniref:hypothetical protein n=1 Tax=Streptomyces sp. SP17BM10 TaxID=3002530 RepID=UPI002E77ABAF|nr:hypothetical protein [Streptomyces sp. SP17BM10]MEE1788268.1 hypothetical protein [Streptomyces sp. SP17BM10]